MEPSPSPARRAYVLGLFTLIYAFNFIDRQIVSILAPELKAALGLADAQIGLLFGTAFALFYALFGLSLARLADGWNRVRTLGLGLALWSGMTMLSGLAGNFAQLGLARIGVGIGEAAASPAAMSVLQDYFPRRQRATVLAIYSSGIYLGMGASLMLGGRIVAWWQARWPEAPPFGLAAWQATYLLVGAPGLLLALLCWATVREPVRGAIDGEPQPGDAEPFRAALGVAATLMPPFSLLGLRGPRLARNLTLLLLCAVGAWAVTAVTDGLLSPARRPAVAYLAGIAITTNLIQWSAIALGLYASLSWIAALRHHDPQATALILCNKAFLALAVGGGVLSLGSYGLSAFLMLYATRYLGAGPADGLVLGAISAVAGGCGTALGGVIADAAHRRHAGGRVFVACAAVMLSTLCLAVQYTSHSWAVFLTAHGLATLFLTMWLGPVFATAQDLVSPRIRGLGVAVQFLAINLIGLGLGPYWVGLASDVTGSLRVAMLSVLALAPVVLALFLSAVRSLPAGRPGR
ncbi:spinster family MFS transporter [Sphingomonas quercus]|uniref:MFS transporter n=1 Tax=Sphingomonas quercus TaxID=2842451 RepID=A0ABS6BHI3_9SPHN|nr:MFS transporter [Sphingomonas quercus]MBU3077761.1 MFS transporter [Sphingomonas quercus]